MMKIKILDNENRIKMWCYTVYNSYLFSSVNFATLVENLIQYYEQEVIFFDDMQAIINSLILLGKRDALINDVEQFKNEGYKNYGFEIPNIVDIDENEYCYPIQKHAQELIDAFSIAAPRNEQLIASYNAFICENQLPFNNLIKNTNCNDCSC